MSAFISRVYFFAGVSDPPAIIFILSVMGIAMFGWSFYTLYVRRRRTNGLVTTGLFRYTRHPMYTGLTLMDLLYWFIPEYNLLFIVTTMAMYISMFVAAYLQENETVARFGDEAYEYYSITPWLIVMYPFRRN